MPNATNLLWDDFVSIVFPKTCTHCHTVLFKNENLLCSTCLLDLPFTYYHRQKENSTFKKLAAIPNLTHASTLFHFHKDGILQSLLHELKYRGNREVGTWLGIQAANHLQESDFATFEVVIPVPIHSSKRKKRGYNQAEIIAESFASKLKMEHKAETVERVQASISQTKLQKSDRWLNVENIFHVKKPEEIEGKSILLLDDVLTTGATLIMLAESLNKVKISRLAVLAIAGGK